MRTGAQLSIIEMRRSARFPVNHMAPGEHRILGEILLAIENISTAGFMVGFRHEIERGDRLVLILPRLGRLEALCMWTKHQQAGFLFERPIPHDEFEQVLASMKEDRVLSTVSQPEPEGMQDAKPGVPNVSIPSSERKRALSFANLCTPNGWEKVRVKDCSETGLRFVSRHAIPVGLDVTFKQGDIFTAAKIVWSAGNEARLEFFCEICA